MKKLKIKEPKTISAYISGFPKGVQEILEKVRGIIHEATPTAKETIKYGIPTFVLKGNLVHFAAFSKHIGLYPTPDVITHFAKELQDYPTAKGSIQFPLKEAIPYKLISDIVKFRVKQNS